MPTRRQGNVRLLYAARGASFKHRPPPVDLRAALTLHPPLLLSALRRRLPQRTEDQAPVFPRAPPSVDRLPVGLGFQHVRHFDPPSHAAQLPRHYALSIRRSRRLAGRHLLKMPAECDHAPVAAIPTGRPRRVCYAGPDRPFPRRLATVRCAAARMARRTVRAVRERADGRQGGRRGDRRA